jgi:ketosteroid isomerase-like protein
MKTVDIGERARTFYSRLDAMDIDGWAALWADDGRIVVLYPPDGFDDEIIGKNAIVGGFRDLFANYERFETEIVSVYPARDADVVTVEYRVRARLVNGVDYTNDNIAVFEFDDGLVRTYRDYFDPRRFQVVVDTLNA